MIFVDQRNDADLVIRMDKVRITNLIVMAIYTLATNEQPKVYAADTRKLPNTFQYNAKDGSKTYYGHVKAFFADWAYFNLENDEYVVPYVNEKLIDKIENKNPNVIAISEAIKALFTIYPAEEAYTKAIEIVVALLKNVIAEAEEFAKIQKKMDEKLSNAEGNVIDVTDMKNWVNHFFNSHVEHDVSFVIMVAVDGSWKFSSIPYESEHVLMGEVIKRVPSEWLNHTVEEVRDFTGVSSLQMLEPRGFGGICETKEDAIKICNLIASMEVPE